GDGSAAVAGGGGRGRGPPFFFFLGVCFIIAGNSKTPHRQTHILTPNQNNKKKKLIKWVNSYI
ncbi:hypothetical protein, partial [Enterobacter hormaechei]